MVHLKALECSGCQNPCDRWSNTNDCESVIKVCAKCAQMLCGNCSHSITPCKCGGTLSECELLSQVCTFARCAPRDQLRLISLKLNTSKQCVKCASVTALYRCGIQEILCEKCRENAIPYWNTSSPLEQTIQEIFSELSKYFRPQNLGPIGCSAVLPLRLALHCNLCGCRLHRASDSNVVNGKTLCADCSPSHSVSGNKCKCLFALMDVMHCIPEDQLKLLTLSKWISKIRCENSSCVLHCEGTLPTLSPEVYVKRNVNSVFKNDAKVEALPAHDNVISDESADSETAMTVHRKLFPEKIRCDCGREDDMANMFDCVTCSKFGICPLCSMKNHRTHEVIETTPSVTLAAVNIHYKRSLSKVTEWASKGDELNKQCGEAFTSLCECLNVAFLAAAAANKNVERVEQLLSETGISHIEKSINELLVAKIKTIKVVDAFCENLIDVVRDPNSEELGASIEKWLTRKTGSTLGTLSAQIHASFASFLKMTNCSTSSG